VKRADIKSGVVYAHKRDMSRAEFPVLVLDMSHMWHDRSTTSGIYDTYSPGDPVFTARDGWNHSNGRRSTGSATGRTGILVAMYLNRNATFNPQVDFATVSKDEALALTLVASDVPYIKTKYPRQDGDIITYAVIDPRSLIAPWDDFTDARDDETERRAAIEAELATESQTRITAAQARYDRLASLGVPGPFPSVSEYKSQSYGREWRPPTYSKEHTRNVVLTPSQFEALLSLIPDGARVPAVEETDDDGWSYKTAPYNQP
jgi:hypothetical protein